MSLVTILGHTALQFGFDPRKSWHALRGMPLFFRDLARYREMGGRVSGFLPMLADRYEAAGTLPRHYFHQDLWAARKIYAASPKRHVDVGSLISGFVAHLLTFRQVEIVDIRPLKADIEGLTVIEGDASRLEMFPDGSLESVSSLHAGEHFGLGRYRDPVDPDGHIRFMHALARVLQPGGRLYFSLPSGIEPRWTPKTGH